MNDDSVISKRLREARVAAGISQKRLGIEAGIDEFSASPRINQYERGKHVPDFATVERFASVLGVPAAYFYARDDELARLILAFDQLNKNERENLLKLFLVDAAKK